MMTTTTPRNDLLARYAVYGLCALALWAGVRAVERPAESARAQDIILQATATPALPSPALAPVVDLALPTPVPVDIVPPALPTPVWPADVAPVAAQDGSGEAQVDNADYLANVGAQAAHSPRGDVDEPPPSMDIGPIAVPLPSGAILVTNPVLPAPAPAMAVAVPAISAAQAQVLGARTSDTCPDGQVFYPRTGCHAEGSGGPQPGAVGEN